MASAQQQTTENGGLGDALGDKLLIHQMTEFRTE